MLRDTHLRVERITWAVGLTLLGYGAFLLLQARVYRDSTFSVQYHSHSAAPLQTTRAAQSPHTRNTAGSLLGRLDIPALSISVAVLSDFESSSLLKGVGHIEGTALPGGLGTVGLVGHRDTFFRPLKNITPGMEIHLTDPTGTYRYAVDSTEIVTPDQVRVLDITDRPGMVLVTCYPFDFVGAAPKRFIVHTHLVSLTPETAPSGSVDARP